MVVPGVQALFGFQLIAVFNQPFFTQLTPAERGLHLAALVLVALAVAFLMAPAAYHRQAEPGGVSAYFVRYATRMLLAAMTLLTGAIVVDVYVIARVIADAPTAVAVAAGVTATFLGLWFAWPRYHRRGAHAPRR